MSINVYWACIESEWMEASEPRSVYKSITGSSFIDKNNQYTRIDMCPSIREKNKNTFELKSIYDLAIQTNPTVNKTIKISEAPNNISMNLDKLNSIL